MAGNTDEFEQSDLGAIIAREIGNAQTYDDGESPTSNRSRSSLALEYIRGRMPDMPARPNGSAQTSRDIQDNISWMLPGIVRIFTSSDQMVEYEPERESDVEWARQATDYMNYVFFKDNDGYRIIYNGTYDSLALRNGIARVYWDPSVKTETQTYYRMTAEQIALLQEEEGVRILAADQNEYPDPVTQEAPEPQEQPQQPQGQMAGADPQDPQQQQAPEPIESFDSDTGEPITLMVPTWDVKIERELTRGKLCIETCKPENLLLDDAATTIDGSRAVGYQHDDKTRSDLIEMGFDREIVDALPSFGTINESETSQARNGDRWTSYDSPVRSGDLIRLYEYYIKIDVDGDGIAELLQVWYVGGLGPNGVLDWSVWEDPIPFVDIPCYPVPHEFWAQSVSDRTMDIQRVKTALLRQALDNTYASGMPQREIEEGSVLNPDSIVNPKFNGPIWKKKGTPPIIPHNIAYTADKSLAAMQYMDSVNARRTGVSDTMMALDPEALQNQTATASQNNRDAAYSQVELIARNHAELGWSKLFSKALKIVAKRQDRPRTIRLRDKFVKMNPMDWNPNMDATVNVGLGSGSKDRDMAMLQVVLNDQVTMASQLGNTPGAEKLSLEYIPKITKTLVKKAGAGGLRNPDAYYPEIDEDDVEQIYQASQQQEQQPDPAAEAAQQKAQADMQLQQAKMQADQAESAAKLQLQSQESQAKLAMSQAQFEQNLQLEREKMTMDLQLKREQLAGELALKREQLIAELQLKKELALAGIMADTAVASNVSVGGEPG